MANTQSPTGIAGKRCAHCNTHTTPLWRNGPGGRESVNTTRLGPSETIEDKQDEKRAAKTSREEGAETEKAEKKSRRKAMAIDRREEVLIIKTG